MGLNISGAILSGGENKRFGGKSKSEMILGDKTIFLLMIEILTTIFDEIIIVTNNPEKYKGHDNFKIVGDQFVKAGPLGGLHAAMKTSTKDAVFAFACDMPFLDKKIIEKQINLFSEIKCQALVPEVDKYTEPLHSIYSNSQLKVLEEFLTENRDYAVRAYLKRIDVHYLNMDRNADTIRAFTNINSPSDLEEIRKISGKNKD